MSRSFFEEVFDSKELSFKNKNDTEQLNTIYVRKTPIQNQSNKTNNILHTLIQII